MRIIIVNIKDSVKDKFNDSIKVRFMIILKVRFMDEYSVSVLRLA